MSLDWQNRFLRNFLINDCPTLETCHVLKARIADMYFIFFKSTWLYTMKIKNLIIGQAIYENIEP